MNLLKPRTYPQAPVSDTSSRKTSAHKFVLTLVLAVHLTSGIDIPMSILIIFSDLCLALQGSHILTNKAVLLYNATELLCDAQLPLFGAFLFHSFALPLQVLCGFFPPQIRRPRGWLYKERNATAHPIAQHGLRDTFHIGLAALQ